MSFSALDRHQHIQNLQEQSFDLAIIGGGINGAGIARDAASRGLKVALVEAKDYAIGTSSRSSKLIHGGIRYLENLEFSLVFEALAERAHLFEMAPHLVHPLRFVIPVYQSSRVGFWKMAAGMWLYDLLALFETPKMHERHSPEDLKEIMPILDRRELVGALEYSDAYMDDDRLVIETLRDAVRMGAQSANYCQVIGANRQGNIIQSLQVRDELSGKTFSLKARQFIGSLGPWTDIVGAQLDPEWKPKLRPTKGVHLIFPKERLPLDRAVVMAVEKRIIFVIPRHEMVIVGTTDTDYNKNPYDVSVDWKDVEYLLSSLNHYFPKLNLKVDDIVASYSGVRPLVNDGSDTEGKTSREHSLFSDGDNLSFIAGGKYTTYRLMAEQAVDFVLAKMPFDYRMKFSRSNTQGPINDQVSVIEYQRTKDQIKDLSESFGFSPSIVENLVDRHGGEAIQLLQLMSEKFHQGQEDEAMWMAEAHFAIEETCCLALKDFYWRRTPLFLSNKNHGLKYLDGIAAVFAKMLKWDAQEVDRQKKELLSEINKEMAWKFTYEDSSEQT